MSDARDRRKERERRLATSSCTACGRPIEQGTAGRVKTKCDRCKKMAHAERKRIRTARGPCSCGRPRGRKRRLCEECRADHARASLMKYRAEHPDKAREFYLNNREAKLAQMRARRLGERITIGQIRETPASGTDLARSLGIDVATPCPCCGKPMDVEDDDLCWRCAADELREA